MRREVVFMHIPKTGGRSVRFALEHALADHLILRDYGDENSTPQLHQLIHELKQPERFRQVFPDAPNGILLSGHFIARRYWRSFNAGSFVTFVRHPVDRVFSAYRHWVVKHGWKDSFEEFLEQPGISNFLPRVFSRVDLESFGFIGFTDQFAQSLAALGEYLGAALDYNEIGPGNYEVLECDVRKDPKCREMVIARNGEEIEFYERLRTARLGTYRAAMPDESRYVGHVRMVSSVAAGWLKDRARESIAEVEVRKNGKPVVVAAADLYREDLKGHGSRSGVCGFRVDLERFASAGAKFSFHAKGGDYELRGSPILL